MFQMRDAHMEAFESRALESFEDRALASIREAAPPVAKGQTDGQVMHDIRERRQAAEQYGLVTEQGVMCFIHVAFLIGLRFDEPGGPAWARPLLTSTLSPVKKATWLLHLALADVRHGPREAGAA